MEQRRIKITAGDVQVTATLNDSRTADLMWDALPITASGSTWGDEIYFRTEVEAKEEDGVEVVDLGDVAYWPPEQPLSSLRAAPVLRASECPAPGRTRGKTRTSSLGQASLGHARRGSRDRGVFVSTYLKRSFDRGLSKAPIPSGSGS